MLVRSALPALHPRLRDRYAGADRHRARTRGKVHKNQGECVIRGSSLAEAG